MGSLRHVHDEMNDNILILLFFLKFGDSQIDCFCTNLHQFFCINDLCRASCVDNTLVYWHKISSITCRAHTKCHYSAYNL